MEIFRQITANNINLKEYPFGKELAMEAYLLENEDILILDKQNFNDVTVLDAEIAIKAGRKNGDGRIDILTKYGGEYLGIVEIKLNEINESTLNQLQDYLDQKEQILRLGTFWTEDIEPKWVGLMVGTSISTDLQEKIRNGYDYKGIPIAGMIIRRFRSDENEIFVVSDTIFSFKYSSKDYSKFVFNGKEFNKGRLVNEVIKHYVELNPQITYSALKNAFPDRIQGSFGVFDKTANAEDIYKRWGHKRHYIEPQELIKLNDETISTCTQWNPKNIADFIKRANELGLNIEIK